MRACSSSSRARAATSATSDRLGIRPRVLLSLRQLRSGDPDYLAPTDAVEGSEIVSCERQEHLYTQIADAVAALRTFTVPRARRLAPVRRLERLAGLLSDQELYEDAPTDMENQLVELCWQRLATRRTDRDFERAVANSKKIGLTATTLTYLTGQTEETSIQVESTSRSLGRLFDQVGARGGAGLHEKLWRRIRREDHTVDGDTARLYVIATLGDSTTTRSLDERARQQFDDWFATYGAQIDALPETPRQEFYQLQEHADAPSDHGLALPLHAVDSRRNDRSTDYPRHLYQDEDGIYPEILNEWEKNVVETELARDGSITWVRNQPRKRWALTVPYDDPAGDPVPMYPDFLFFRRAGDRVVVDLVDPHGVHFDDAPAKARGLATYAQRFGHLYASIDLVIYDKQTRRQRRLQLKQVAVRDHVRRVQNSEHLRALFDLAGT